MSGNRTYQIDLQYRYPGMFVLSIREGEGEPWKRLDISRHMAGILFLFTFTPEIYRDEIYAYLYKLSEDDPKIKPIKTTISRVIITMIKNGLIREVKVGTDRVYHQTMKGRAVWLFIADHLARDRTLPSQPDQADRLGFGVKKAHWTEESILQNIDDAARERAGQHTGNQEREVIETLKTMLAYLESLMPGLDINQALAKVGAALRPSETETKPIFEDIELEDIEGEES